MNELLILLAQATPAGKPPPSAAAALLPMALMAGIVVFMVLSSRSQKKREQREKDEMHARMAKNDRVLTIGGVVGTVIAVKDNEVVVKVDESTNTKMTFVKTAIQRILTDEKSSLKRA